MKCIMCGEQTESNIKPMCNKCMEFNKIPSVEITNITDIEHHLQQIYSQLRVLSETVRFLSEFNTTLIENHNAKIRNKRSNKAPNMGGSNTG